MLLSSIVQGVPGMESLNESSNNSSGKPLQDQHVTMHHYHHNHMTPNVRRYPTMPSIEPAQIPMYPTPPPMYTTQNSPCYACLTVPVGMQNRYTRYVHTSEFFLKYCWEKYLIRRIVFPDATLSMCTALHNCKRCGLTPRTIVTVLRVVVLTAQAVDHLLKHHRPHHGSVAAAAGTIITSHRPLPITWRPRRCIQQHQHLRMLRRHLNSQCSLQCHRRAGSLLEKIHRRVQWDRRIKEYWMEQEVTGTTDRRVYRIVSPSLLHRHSSRIYHKATSRQRYGLAVASTPTSYTDRRRDQPIRRRTSRTAKLCIRIRGILRLEAPRLHRRRTRPLRRRYKRHTCRPRL